MEVSGIGGAIVLILAVLVSLFVFSYLSSKGIAGGGKGVF